jgi:iron(III) transport system permease protein
MKALHGRFGQGTARVAVVLGLAYLVLVPAVILVAASLRDSSGRLPFSTKSPWSLRNYAEVFLQGRTYELLWNTILLSFGALVLAFAISLAAAWLVERTNLPARGFAFVMIIAGIGTPGFISAIAWTLLLNPSNGFLNVMIRGVFGIEGDGPFNISSMPGMILVEGLGLVPVTFLLLTAAFRALDVSLEDAGSLSGAHPRVVARKITLPLLTPAIFSAFVYQFATTIESFDVPVTLGLRNGIVVLPTEIYLRVRPSTGLPDYGLASTYGILLIAVVLAPLWYYQKIISRSERYATVSGNAYRTRRVALTLRGKILGLGFLALFVLLEFVLPTLMLLYTSLQPFFAVPTFEKIANSSVNAYRDLFHSQLFFDSLNNSLLIAVVAAIATMTLAAIVSWFVVRSRTLFRSVLDVLAFIPHSIPALVMGLAIAMIYLYVTIPIYGTIWIIVIALMTRYISLATRQMNTGIGAIKRELEEAGAASGGSPRQTFRRILVPLAMPAYINGFLLVALLGVKNLSIPLVLGGADSPMLASLIWNRWDNGDTAQTGALSVVMVAITLVLGTLSYLVGQQGGMSGRQQKGNRRPGRRTPTGTPPRVQEPRPTPVRADALPIP